jgi:hypothetical protein
MLTKTVLALPLEDVPDVQGGAGGGLPHKRYRASVQAERLKLFTRGKWKLRSCMTFAWQHNSKASAPTRSGGGGTSKVASGNAGAGLGLDQMHRTTLPRDR